MGGKGNTQVLTDIFFAGVHGTLLIRDIVEDGAAATCLRGS